MMFPIDTPLTMAVKIDGFSIGLRMALVIKEQDDYTICFKLLASDIPVEKENANPTSTLLIRIVAETGVFHEGKPRKSLIYIERCFQNPFVVPQKYICPCIYTFHPLYLLHVHPRNQKTVQ
jgi:hypothetical protein